MSTSALLIRKNSLRGEAKPLNNSERVPGQWIQNEKGWRFTNTDGSRPVNDWACSGDKWYYFGADGYMVTGWIQWEGNWYYLGPEGDMQTNTLTPDGYIVDEERCPRVVKNVSRDVTVRTVTKTYTFFKEINDAVIFRINML